MSAAAKACLDILDQVEPGKGIRGWVAPGEAAAAPTPHASPAKPGAGGLMSHVGRAPGGARAGGKGAGLGSGPAPDVKVVVGNKQMLALEGLAVPQAVDEWMREREVCVLPSLLEYMSLWCLCVSAPTSSREANAVGFAGVQHWMLDSIPVLYSACACTSQVTPSNCNAK